MSDRQPTEPDTILLAYAPTGMMTRHYAVGGNPTLCGAHRSRYAGRGLLKGDDGYDDYPTAPMCPDCQAIALSWVILWGMPGASWIDRCTEQCTLPNPIDWWSPPRSPHMAGRAVDVRTPEGHHHLFVSRAAGRTARVQRRYGGVSYHLPPASPEE